MSAFFPVQQCVRGLGGLLRDLMGVSLENAALEPGAVPPTHLLCLRVLVPCNLQEVCREQIIRHLAANADGGQQYSQL